MRSSAELAVEDTKLQTDVYVPWRRQLIEAKAAATREMIRMAIGQIADYALQIASAPDALDMRDRAVLLPRRPSLSLEELLDSEGIGAVWRTDDGAFEDNREGLFTS